MMLRTAANVAAHARTHGRNPPLYAGMFADPGGHAPDDVCVVEHADGGLVVADSAVVTVSAPGDTHSEVNPLLAHGTSWAHLVQNGSVDASAARNEPKIRFVQESGRLAKVVVPRNHNEARRHARAPQFWEAMLREWQSQEECHTFEPCAADDPALADIDILSLGWVYDVKVNTLTNELIKYKARLIARGQHAVFQVHYYDTYSGVVRMSTVRLLLAMAAAFG